MNKHLLAMALVAVAVVARADPPGPISSRPIISRGLSLRDAVAIAERESPVIRGAAAEVQAAEARVRGARAERAPAVSANLFASGGSLPNIFESPREVQPSMIMALPHGAYVDGNLMLMLPLTTGGRIEATTRAATALRNASFADLMGQRQEVALMTRTAYWQVLARRQAVEAQQARLNENQEQLRVDQARVEEGKLPAFNVQRDEAELAATEQETTNAQRDVELGLLELKTIMGLHPSSQLTLTDSLGYDGGASLRRLAPMSNPLPTLLALAERRRPELGAAAGRSLAAQAQQASASSAFAPQINAFASGDLQKSQGSRAGGGTTFGLVASVPLLDGGQRDAGVDEAAAMARKREQERAQQALQIGREVATALLNLRAAEQNIAEAQTALTSAREDYRVARLRYEAGRSVLTESLDALSARAKAENNSVQALLNYVIASDQLLRATGTLPE